MHCGLIDASSNEEFDYVLDSLQKTWNEHELPYTPRASSPSFHSWFVKEKLTISRSAYCQTSDVTTVWGTHLHSIALTTMKQPTRC